jgi:hypothetical protein
VKAKVMSVLKNWRNWLNQLQYYFYYNNTNLNRECCIGVVSMDQMILNWLK